MQVDASQSNKVENIEQRLTRLEKQSQPSYSTASNLTLAGLAAGLGAGLLSLSTTGSYRYGLTGLNTLSITSVFLKPFRSDIPYLATESVITYEHIFVRLLGSTLIGAAVGTICGTSFDALLRLFSNAIEVQAANKKLNDNLTSMHNLSQRSVELA